MKCPYVIKVCSKCKRILVANISNFKKNKGGKYGLFSVCKKCEKKYREDNKKKIHECQKRYYDDNKEKLKDYRKRYYKKNKEKEDERNKQYYKKNKKDILEYHEQYYTENKDEILEYHKQYYTENKNKILEKNKLYRDEHKDELKEKKKKYNKENPHIRFNNSQKRRHKLKNQGNGISKEQWLEMMEFFDWKCAYSGESLDMENRSIDHIISLNNEGLNEPWNCIPMYMPHNSSKHNKDMVSWYKQQEFFDIDRLMKIYEWQEYAFEKWGLS